MKEAFRLGLIEWIQIFTDVAQALSKAWRVRLTHKNPANPLPPVAPSGSLSIKHRDRITYVIDYFLTGLLFWKPGRCYYRSFVLASVLRKRGISIILNLGCANFMELNGKAKAHCWLTLEGKLFAEKKDPLRIYYRPVGGINGQVNYWLGSPNNSSTQVKTRKRPSLKIM